VWTEDILVTRKEACGLEDFSRYFACCSSHVCNVELFANLSEGDDLHALLLNGAILKLLGSRMFSGDP